jgi:FG-GAP repeat
VATAQEDDDATDCIGRVVAAGGGGGQSRVGPSRPRRSRWHPAPMWADFDNDGSADLAVGVPVENENAGAVNVLYGTGGGLTGAGGQLFTQVGGAVEAGDEFGAQLANGDFNDNGPADLAAAAPAEDVGSVFDAGVVSVLYGAGGGLTTSGGQLFTQNSPGVPGGARPWTASEGSASRPDKTRDPSPRGRWSADHWPLGCSWIPLLLAPRLPGGRAQRGFRLAATAPARLLDEAVRDKDCFVGKPRSRRPVRFCGTE